MDNFTPVHELTQLPVVVLACGLCASHGRVTEFEKGRRVV